MLRTAILDQWSRRGEGTAGRWRGRWVEISPELLPGWLDGFYGRHDGATEQGLVLTRANNGDTATLHPPPRLDNATEVDTLLASLVQPPRIALLLARKGAAGAAIVDGTRPDKAEVTARGNGNLGVFALIAATPVAMRDPLQTGSELHLLRPPDEHPQRTGEPLRDTVTVSHVAQRSPDRRTPSPIGLSGVCRPGQVPVTATASHPASTRRRTAGSRPIQPTQQSS